MISLRKYIIPGFLISIVLVSCCWFNALRAQQPRANQQLRINLNESKSHWIRFSTFTQLWARVNENNPGTNIQGEDDPYTADLSIRRFRFATFSQVGDRLFVFLQLGKNNLNYLSPRGTSLDLLDAYAEYTFTKQFTFGGGKSPWNGLSRYTAPNSAKQLTLDLPLIALPTLDATDDLTRKLSVYAKGKLSALDYRLVLSKPFSTQNMNGFNPSPIEGISRFTDSKTRPQYAAYLKYEFWEKESNLTSTAVGTYLGSKKVMTLGAGFIFQEYALWSLKQGDTTFHHLALLAVDFFLEIPFHQKKKTAINLYTALFNYDFGPNYIRLIGANNPGYALDPAKASFNGRGNAFPLSGTGNTWLTQAGYLFPEMGSNGKWGQLQPYFMTQLSNFDRLNSTMFYVDLGVNWFFNGHLSKLSFNAQQRPIFIDQGEGLERIENRYQFILQYQVRIE